MKREEKKKPSHGDTRYNLTQIDSDNNIEVAEESAV